ncbi:hypothetical protein [Autumnicola psychrophila]|uniref:Uncharacterized protein n=1 Tax=Autumnicola psychrophila TaxID=3075592 RepID=A0ABU3DPD6_9FLAO|nr:hypothetical protein [Zunongwangia sp. F225]MDT0685569.1 hypothetical protein [Zunongwangia sp. F225]
MEKEIIEQKKVAKFIRTLEGELEVLQKKERAAGWSQRNALIEHVYSNYDRHENLIAKKEKWENIGFQCRILEDILELMIRHRDIYGLYNISGMKRELDNQLSLAERLNEFEIAEVILDYKIRLEKVSKEPV